MRTTVDKGKANSILKLVLEPESFVSTINHEKFPTNAAENYYEIIKELASALLLLDGLKTSGESAHKDLIDYLRNYHEFSEADIFFINDLRIKRNNSFYEGKKIDFVYLEHNKNKILGTINRLKAMLKKKL